MRGLDCPCHHFPNLYEQMPSGTQGNEQIARYANTLENVNNRSAQHSKFPAMEQKGKFHSCVTNNSAKLA